MLDEPLAVTARTLDLALALEVPAELGANDRLHVASCIEHGIAAILSADRSFDMVDGLERIDLRRPAPRAPRVVGPAMTGAVASGTADAA